MSPPVPPQLPLLVLLPFMPRRSVPPLGGTCTGEAHVPSGGATTVEFKVDVPGKYILVDHSLGRAMKGAVGILQVSGPENPEVFLPQP